MIRNHICEKYNYIYETNLLVLNVYEGLVSCHYETTMPENNLMTFKSNIKQLSHSTSFLKHEYLGLPFNYDSHISRKIMV